MQKIYLSDTNKKIAGVLGGIAQGLNIDPILLRLPYMFVTIATFVVPGVITYLLGLILLPIQPILNEGEQEKKSPLPEQKPEGLKIPQQSSPVSPSPVPEQKPAEPVQATGGEQNDQNNPNNDPNYSEAMMVNDGRT